MIYTKLLTQRYNVAPFGSSSLSFFLRSSTQPLLSCGWENRLVGSTSVATRNPLDGTRRNYGSVTDATPPKESSRDAHLIDFSTLHELQKSACRRFSSNPLFGTFNPAIQDFQYLSYGDFDKEVNRCRSVLRSIGKLIQNNEDDGSQVCTSC